MGRCHPGRPPTTASRSLRRSSLAREPVFYEYSRKLEKAVADKPDCLAVLKLHYLRWVLFPIKGDTYFMYQGIFDTDFDKYTEDAVALFTQLGVKTVFENLEGFPKDWQTNARGVHQVRPRAPVPEFPGVRRISVRQRGRDQEGASRQGAPCPRCWIKCNSAHA